MHEDDFVYITLSCQSKINRFLKILYSYIYFRLCVFVSYKILFKRQYRFHQSVLICQIHYTLKLNHEWSQLVINKRFYSYLYDFTSIKKHRH